MARSLKPLLRSFETGSDWNGRKPSCFYNMFCVCIFDKKLGISVSLMWCFAHCANSGVFVHCLHLTPRKHDQCFYGSARMPYTVYKTNGKHEVWHQIFDPIMSSNLPWSCPAVCLLLSQVLAHLGGQLFLNLALVPGAVDDKDRVLLQVTCHVLSGGQRTLKSGQRMLQFKNSLNCKSNLGVNCFWHMKISARLNTRRP